MNYRYSKHFLNKLEDIIAESDYLLRYEKGNFKPGYCILRDTKVIIVNKYYPTEGKINCLLDILKAIEIHPDALSDKNKKLYLELTQITLQL